MKCSREKCTSDHTVRKCHTCKLLKDMKIIIFKNNLGALNISDCLAHPDQLIYIWKIIVPTTKKLDYNLQLGDFCLYKFKNENKATDILTDYLTGEKNNTITDETLKKEFVEVESIPDVLNDPVFYPIIHKYKKKVKQNGYPLTWGDFSNKDLLTNSPLHTKIIKNNSNIMKINKKQMSKYKKSADKIEDEPLKKLFWSEETSSKLKNNYPLKTRKFN